MKEIVQDEKYLGPDFVPEELVNRDEEIDRMEKFLLPVHKRSNVLLLYGPSGTGKTTCVKILLQDVQEDTTAETIYLDCWE